MTLYVPVVTLTTGDDKLLKQIKSGFKITLKWNRYRSERTKQTKTKNLNCIIDPTFNKVNRLFVSSYSKQYTPEVEIKDFNVLINGKVFLMWQ